MQRKTWDRIVSGAGVVMAVVLIVLGGLAIYGGRFGQDNVQERLAPQNITLPPAEVLSPAEAEAVGSYAGQAVDTGPEALAFANYIGVHLEGINEGATYSETSAAAREEGIAPDVAAELQGKADTLFKGEALRSILLNAYGWWTVSTIAVYAGFAMIVGGIVLAILAALGFRHARRNHGPVMETVAVAADARVLETV
jgi:hypothetical protein